MRFLKKKMGIRSLNKRKAALLGILVIALIAWIIWGNTTVGTTYYSVESDRIPPSFNHFKIIVISDMHNALFGEDNESIINLVKKEKPDLIAITGDLVDSNRTNIEIAGKLVENLMKIAPCYYVTGNHEAWLGEEYKKLESILIEKEVTILNDEVVMLANCSDQIQIAGLNDPDFVDRVPYVQRGILQTKLSDMDLTNDYIVLLSHRPETFDAYVAKNIDLVLSGHAHGGQFRIPIIGGLIAPNQGIFPKYDAGMYCEKSTTMIVSRGIGNSIITLRLNNRPEIVCVELIGNS